MSEKALLEYVEESLHLNEFIDSPIFHRTPHRKLIESSGNLRASFILNTTDQREFWLPFKLSFEAYFSVLNHNPNDPKTIALKELIAKNTVSPDIKPFFISACKDKFAIPQYGPDVLEIATTSIESSMRPQEPTLFFVPCRYFDESEMDQFVKGSVSNFLHQMEKIFVVTDWTAVLRAHFHMVIMYCALLACSVKRKQFAHEQEVRLLFFSKSNGILDPITAAPVLNLKIADLKKYGLSLSWKT